MVHAVRSDSGSIAFCQCGQGFSGARVQERLAAHIAAPDPNSIGAMLIGYIKSEVG